MFALFWILGAVWLGTIAYLMFSELGKVDSSFLIRHALIGWFAVILIGLIPWVNVIIALITTVFYVGVVMPENKDAWYNKPYGNKKEKK